MTQKKKDERISIFTIERRIDFPKSFAKFFEDLQSTVTTSSGDTYKMFIFLNRCVRYWPHRCGATGIDDYLKAIGVDITSPKDDKDLFLAFELLINLLHWAPTQDYNDDQNTEFGIALKKNDVELESDRLIRNAEYILEQCCNMTIRKVEDEAFPKYYITKRDSYVDAAVAAVPELGDILLGYLDIRNADSVEYKKSALTTIYGHMEPHRKEYKSSICSSISEEFFSAMNTFGIRHNAKSQIRIHPKKMLSVCDKLFMMAVFVLQTDKVIRYKTDLKELREGNTKATHSTAISTKAELL